MPFWSNWPLLKRLALAPFKRSLTGVSGGRITSLIAYEQVKLFRRRKNVRLKKHRLIQSRLDNQALLLAHYQKWLSKAFGCISLISVFTIA